MIFALFIILLFAGMVAFMQFGPAETNAQPRAKLYAENMLVWHQAAILEAQEEMSAGTILSCAAPVLCMAVDLNPKIWNNATRVTINKFNELWPEYQPMIPISTVPGPASGWQSYLIRNINSQDGTTGTTADHNEAYVITVFRGFGNRTAPINNVGSEKGSIDESNFVRNLATSVTDRTGIGTLACNSTTPPPNGSCQFFRTASQTVPDSPAATQSDEGRRFPLNVFSVFARTIFDGRPAIMTRVNDN